MELLCERCKRLVEEDVCPFCGGTAKEIRKGKIYLLKRGEAYLIEGKRFFTFGGAFSTDKARRLAIERTYGGEKCWWERELPSPEEYRHAAETLKKYNYRFDCVITHNSALTGGTSGTGTRTRALTGEKSPPVFRRYTRWNRGNENKYGTDRS